MSRDVHDANPNHSNLAKPKHVANNQKKTDRPAAVSDKGHVKDRRESILSVIKNKNQASIKDISTLIRGVSEKTIQRELSSLVEEGIVLKKGERRWSTYSLA
jgi:DNA-binding transcriptional ArsR family regulator